MAEEDDFLVLSSGDEDEEKEDGASKKKRLLKRKKPSSPVGSDNEELKPEPMDVDDPGEEEKKEEEEPLMDFGAGIFDDDEDEEEAVKAFAAVLPEEPTMVLWQREFGLMEEDYRPNCPPIPVPEDSVKAHNFKKSLDQAEATAPNDPETKRLRKVWNHYVEARERYYGPEREVNVVELLSGSTSNFSTMADVSMFYELEADEEGGDDEEKALTPKKAKAHPRLPSAQRSIASFFNTAGTAGHSLSAAMQPAEVDEYDENDGWCVPDGHVEEDEEPVQDTDPADMSAEELGNFRDTKRRKLDTEQDELRLKLEELEALQQEIADHRQTIEDLTALVGRCDDLMSKGKQEEQEEEK